MNTPHFFKAAARYFFFQKKAGRTPWEKVDQLAAPVTTPVTNFLGKLLSREETPPAPEQAPGSEQGPVVTPPGPEVVVPPGPVAVVPEEPQIELPPRALHEEEQQSSNQHLSPPRG